MAASWTLEPSFILDEGVAGTGALSAFQSLLPGESASVEVFRFDLIQPHTEQWFAEIIPSVDGLIGTDISILRRVYSELFNRPIFVVDSLGTPFYAVRIQNADGSPMNIVKATVRINRDGVNLP